MSVHTNASPPSTSGSPKGQLGRNALLATIGGSVVLMAIAGAGFWSRSDSREASSPVDAAAVQPASNTIGSAVRLSPGLKSPDMVWIYIVSSEAEAAELRTAAASVPGSPSKVIVVSSKAEANYAADLYRSLNSVSAQAGQPQVEVRVLGSLANAQ